MTPFQFAERVEAYAEENEREVQRIKFASWLTAALQRGKHLRSLRSLLNEGRTYSRSEAARMAAEMQEREERIRKRFPDQVVNGRAHSGI